MKGFKKALKCKSNHLNWFCYMLPKQLCEHVFNTLCLLEFRPEPTQDTPVKAGRAHNHF